MGSVAIGGGVEVHFHTVFFKQFGDFVVFVGDRELGQIAQHGGPDLVLELSGGFDLLLLGLKLLLLVLDGELMGLDIILQLEKLGFETLVGPGSDKKPDAQEQGEAARGCG
jgi:hypothetical protein